MVPGQEIRLVTGYRRNLDKEEGDRRLKGFGKDLELEYGEGSEMFWEGAPREKEPLWRAGDWVEVPKSLRPHVPGHTG